MASRTLAAIRDVLRIRTAQRDTARAAVLLAKQDLLRVREAEEDRRAARDAAEQGWQGQLQARRPDPRLVRLAADWLIEREQQVEAARLDTHIAFGAHDAAEHIFGQALASLDATHAIRSRLQRETSRQREAHDLAQAADQFLQRRRR